MVMCLLKQSDQEASGSISRAEAVANETLQGTKGLLGRVGGANETQTEGTIPHAKQYHTCRADHVAPVARPGS